MAKTRYVVVVEYEVVAEDHYVACEILEEHLAAVGELAPDQIVGALVSKAIELQPNEEFISASGGC